MTLQDLFFITLQDNKKAMCYNIRVKNIDTNFIYFKKALLMMS